MKLKYTLRLVFRCADEDVAKSLVEAFIADNTEIPLNMIIVVSYNGFNEVTIEVKGNKLSRLKNTINDIIRCILPILKFI